MFWESPERREGSQSIGDKKTEQTRGWIRDGFTLHHNSSPKVIDRHYAILIK
jgi:hypothetical protein